MPQVKKFTEFEKELTSLINRYSLENDSNTPDFVLASYLTDCLIVWNTHVKKRTDFKLDDLFGEEEYEQAERES